MKLPGNVVIEASAQSAWKVVGEEFGDVATWMSGMRNSSLEGELGVGASRVCETASFGPFSSMKSKEQLIEFDRKKLTFTYRATDGLPAMFRAAQNTWQVNSLGENRCEVTFDATVRLKWWAAPLGLILPMMLKRDFRKFESEIKYRIENGRPHPRNQEMLANAETTAT